MIYKTYEQWQEEDCHVMRGEKSHKRNSKGEAVFSEDQVEDNEDSLGYMDEWDVHGD